MRQETKKVKPFVVEPPKTVSLTPQRHLLCVDDEETIAHLTAHVLATSGYFVTALCDPVLAVELFHNANIELAVLDYQMPKMSGTSLAARLKSTMPQLKIVLFTGTLRISIADVSQVDAFVSKSDGVHALLETVHKLLATP